ncbi:GNAT family N-acetyltransferase [Yimella sp. cx-51]|uniref:GNAT family N-acetyltransferase n=1 Tax=Yimella sp. cx-51 TaxID=2770551 RepID=UPI00165DA8DF|nr:GNAT family N-acetyltransferase [Yimella sp. cx-51]MBC9958279.1 GNAT family N-acetyltransferase [Yimella sp. cx-51]QTH38696.1 GNAT family N-acetyltransferase [Yimella sp. cx-51]
MTVTVRPIDLLSDDVLAQQWIDVQARSGAADWGAEHSAWTLAEVQGRRRGTGYAFEDFVAIDGEQVIGMAAIAMPLRDNEHLGLLMLHVDPEHRRSGVGTALAESALNALREAGRTTVQAETEIPSSAVESGGPKFAQRFGFTCVQKLLRSAMPLPGDRRRLEQLAAGDGIEDAAAFRLDWRIDEIPDDWLPSLALLEQRMSTDAPQGGMTVEEEAWTPERVRENLDWALEAGRRIVQAVAFEGEMMVGFTQIEVSQDTPGLGYQQDTLVLREARGNGLGLRLKALAALTVMDHLPQVTRVRTWNADDNKHMLAVNTDLGYGREGVLQVWERGLDGWSGTA